MWIKEFYSYFRESQFLYKNYDIIQQHGVSSIGEQAMYTRSPEMRERVLRMTPDDDGETASSRPVAGDGRATAWFAPVAFLDVMQVGHGHERSSGDDSVSGAAGNALCRPGKQVTRDRVDHLLLSSCRHTAHAIDHMLRSSTPVL